MFTDNEFKLNDISLSIQRYGMCKDAFVAVESLAPNVLRDAGIRHEELSDDLSDLMLDETLVAIEAGFLGVGNGTGLKQMVRFFNWLGEKVSGTTSATSVMSKDANEGKIKESLQKQEKAITQEVKQVETKLDVSDVEKRVSNSAEISKFAREIGNDSKKLVLVRYLNRRLANNDKKDAIIKEALKMSASNIAVPAMLATTDRLLYGDVILDVDKSVKVCNVVEQMVRILNVELPRILHQASKHLDADRFNDEIKKLVGQVGNGFDKVHSIVETINTNRERNSNRVTLLDTEYGKEKLNSSLLNMTDKALNLKSNSTLTSLAADVTGNYKGVKEALNELPGKIEKLKLTDEDNQMSFGERLFAISNKNSSHSARLGALNNERQDSEEIRKFNAALKIAQSQLTTVLRTAVATFWQIGRLIDIRIRVRNYFLTVCKELNNIEARLART